MDYLPRDWESGWADIKERRTVSFVDPDGESHDVFLVQVELGKELFWGVYDHWWEFDDGMVDYPALFRDPKEAEDYVMRKLSKSYGQQAAK